MKQRLMIKGDDRMVRVLFLCVHNSARSQMGEAFLNDLGKGLFVAESAGLERGTLNPYVVEAMAEVGYDIAGNQVDAVFDFFKEGRQYSYVIKVCDEINGQRCPIFPHTLQEHYWNLPDPAAFTGTHEEILAKVREIRDEIQRRVLRFIEDHKAFAMERI
jgi:arsenate reductase